jgi:hypothetical protein
MAGPGHRTVTWQRLSSLREDKAPAAGAGASATPDGKPPQFVIESGPWSTDSLVSLARFPVAVINDRDQDGIR